MRKKNTAKILKKVKKGIALLLTAGLVVSLAACDGTAGKTGKTEQTGENGESADTKSDRLTVCVGPSPQTLDPSLNVAMDVGTILSHLFEGLYTLAEDGAPTPAQAERCEISRDGLTYTFTLRDGLVWSDQTKVTANDYVYSWKRLADPASGNANSYMMQCVEGYEEAIEENNMELLRIEAPDDHTFVVHLKVPASYFLSMISSPYFLPVHRATIEKYGENWAISPEHYVSNGPFVMKEWTQDSYVLLEKNPSYWNAAEVLPQEIRFLFFSDHGSELLAFETEEISFADDIPLEEMGRMREDGALRTMPLMGNYYLSFQTEKKPLDNALVRKALTLALDRSWLCENIGKSGETPAGAFVPPVIRDKVSGGKFRDQGEYFDPSKSANEANLAAAKEALREAGYPDGVGLPVLELLYVEGSVYEAMAEAVQGQWAAIGVKTHLVRQEWGSFISTMQSRDYQAASLSWMGDYDDPSTFLSLFITDGGNNYSAWSDAQYDALIEEITGTVLPEAERMEKLHEAEDILFDQWVLCPLYYFVDAYVQSPSLKGVRTSVYGTKSFVRAHIGEP